MLEDLATATTMALGRSRLAMLVVKALNSRMRYLYLQKTEEKRRDHGLMESGTPKWCSPPRERSSSYQAWSEKMTIKASGWSKLMRNAEGDIRRAEPQHRVCRDND